MRRTLIQTVLPLVFCLVPLLAGVVVAVAIPTAALHDYLERIRSSPMDWLILALGAVLFTLQTLLGWRPRHPALDVMVEHAWRWRSSRGR